MKYFILLIIASLSAFASTPGETNVHPSTHIEEIHQSFSAKNDKPNYLSMRMQAEKYFSIHSPDATSLEKYYEKNLANETLDQQPLVKEKIEVLKKGLALYEKNKNGYTTAQQLLTEDSKKQSFAALVFLEMYFKTGIDAPESAWVMRVKLRKHLYPDHAFYVMYYFTQKFPKSMHSTLYAKEVKSYLANDYRPDTQDRDLPTYEKMNVLKDLSKFQ